MDKPLFQRIFSIKQKCSSREEAIRRDLGVNHSEFHALLSLTLETAVQGNVLAERMSLSPSRASRVVSKLLEKNFIQTEYHPHDRRSQFIRLTESGQEMKEAIESRLQLCERRILDKYSDQDVRVIKWALGLLDDAL